MRHALPVVFLVLSIHVEAQFKNAPSWVKSPPSEEFAYYGIGQSSPKEDDDYRINARNMALREITEKIFVSIDATSELQVKYANDKITYNLDETIEVASSNFLSGYEQIDQWTSKRGNDYFVHIRIRSLKKQLL
jgi:DNA-dependent RNA polymerase auxiliary subunit epsilon